MYLRDFAETRGVKVTTVAQYIREHPEIDALTTMDGKFKVLSDEAIDILDKKYPMPKPVQVVQDTESLKKLAEAQQTIINMQQIMLEMAAENKQLALQAERVLMLEASERQKTEEIGRLEADIDRRDEIIDEREKQLSEEKQAHQVTVHQLEDTKQQLTAAQQELAEFQSLPWYKKAFWKKK